MASHSPQRSRRPQTQQLNQGAMLNHQPREASPSPSLRDRPRAMKAQSMPMVPSVTSFPGQPTSQSQQQPSPTIPNNGMRRTPPLGQVTRLLPTPPQPNPPNFTEDRRMSPPPGAQQSLGQQNGNPHYGRPPLRAPTAAYPNKFQELESQMTPEFFADIDRAAEQQQAQYQSIQPHSYSSAPRGESPLPSKGLAVDRARAPAERSSPSNPETAQQRGRREQLVARESPKTRDRQPASPIASSFAQAQLQSHSPERRNSPGQHSPLVMPGEPHPASYLAQYNARESPPVVRRAPNSEPRLTASIPTQNPASQTIAARNPDRSLPVQEEDEVTSKNGASVGANWQVKEEIVEQPFQSSSPTPSSDLNPEGNNQRFDNNSANNHQPTHRDDEKVHERDSTEEEGGYTPRSPTAGLPEDNREMYYNGQNIPVRVPVPVAHRAKPRNGTTEHLMRGLDSTLLEQQMPTSQMPMSAAPPQQAQPSERPPQYVDQRQPAQGNGNHFQNYPPPQEYGYNHGSQPNNGERYVTPQVYPDDFHSYGEESTSAYIQSYLQSPRPDAPVPPTPHSQTAAPSPSPMLSTYGAGKEIPAYRRSFGSGSPYPFPFDHMRRNRQVHNQRFFPNGVDPNHLTDKIARQWQVYAQNNQGNITDSTLSPSSTPFQPELYDHWAYLHTARMMGNAMLDTASMQSSPSHQPIALPIPPNFSTKKKERNIHGKRQSYNRKPPPRVESTQPRETSPELSSSGEETAGEERYSGVTEHAPADPLPFPVVDTPTAVDSEDNGEWVDEDEEDDYEDLIDLEYHPAFVKNVSKRRRKWEVGWENLIQAFQALDRQTDATMVLLASPSHTTKLHALRSRSIRRQPILASSLNMNQIRSGFASIAAQRRATRPDKSSLVDRLSGYSGSSGGDGSDGSSASGSVEDNLRRALDAALGSLGAMGEVYEQREARVLEELQRSREDRERVELLLRQVLGDKNPLSNAPPRPAS